jgi:hypothetical protein
LGSGTAAATAAFRNTASEVSGPTALPTALEIASPWAREAHLLALVSERGRAEDLAPQMGEHLLRQGHEVLVVRVGLVEFQHRELGVVLRRDPLVAEAPVDLIDAVEPADHQPLQVQLGGDAQVQRHVQRVVVRHEGLGRRPAGDGLHHRRFDLEEAARVQKSAHLTDQPALDHEHLADLGVHHEVHVAAPVPGLDVPEPVPFLRQRPERFGEELETPNGDGQLTRARPEELARHADEIADVEVGE